MIGNMKWNLGFSLVGMLLTFLFSWLHNPFLTALTRSLYCFALLFVFVFVVRFFLGTIANIEWEKAADKEEVGTHIDLTTPDETEEIQEALKQAASDTTITDTAERKNDEQGVPKPEEKPFSPLNPPRLKSIDKSTDQLVRAVRQMSELEGR
jgi:hypothetical protein